MKLNHLAKGILTLIACLSMSLPINLWAANTKTSIEQVTETVTLTDDVDYIITSNTPFGGSGVVNIVNTEHAVLILNAVKPSKALSLLNKHVQVNGTRAQNNVNCQVKIYNRGCIIMPYDKDIKPLTVFAEQNFQGETCNDFGLENSGGFMNTLTDAKLNNRIRSFKLKRGYMVTFSLLAKGRGYSRCFVAADKDVEMATLPGILDRSISSYRIFKWYDTGKQALANDTRSDPVSALNVTSCYSFSLGEDRGIDCECVPHHIYEDWPSAAACGGVTYSPHLKTNNEPGNSADDHPQTVATILDNWQNLMATGMRLCSPSSHDGSLGHLREFMDSIDARGWRCDIIDLHCYWPESSFNEWSFKTQWVDRYHRPIWISEWVWGASWNQNGAFANGVTEQQNAEAVKRICEKLNGWDYIERYFYWNSERDPSRIYKDGALTAAGKYYATINSGLGYNSKYDYAPRIPKQKGPDNLVVTFDKNTHTATLTWHDYNGEMNAAIIVERRANNTSKWETVGEVAIQETEADYTFQDPEASNGCQYRVCVTDANNKDNYTKIVMAASDDLQAGDAVTVDGATRYLGGNIFINGDFDMGTWGWADGQGQPLAATWFQAVPVGGNDGGSYLQAYGDGGADAETSLKTVFDINPNSYYYFSGAVCNTATTTTCQLRLTNDGSSTTGQGAIISNPTANWLTQFSVFNSGDNTKAIIAFRRLGAKTQVDQLWLAQLFETQQEAIDDGISKALAKAAALADYYQDEPLQAKMFNDLAKTDGISADLTTLRQREQAISQAVKAAAVIPLLKRLSARARILAGRRQLADYEQLAAACDEADRAVSESAFQGASHLLECYDALQDAFNAYMPLVNADVNVTNSNFKNGNTGWTINGTYKGGDQRVNSKDGVSFWNAWWSLQPEGNEDQSMGITQTVKSLAHGLYALECKATTEHYCTTDQHGYLIHGDDTELTDTLSACYFDLPSVSHSDRWQTLTTLPVYIDEGESVTIGFTGTKNGAQDNLWHEVGNTSGKGDHREGWWAATDFVLKFHPLYCRTVTPQQWNVICLPYAFTPSEGMHLYQIAGINHQFDTIFLEEISEAEAGVPCIFRTSEAKAIFLEYGTTVNRAEDGAGGLRGFLKSSANQALGYYALRDGAWVKVTRDNQEKLTNYTALLRPFTDSRGGMPLLHSWQGESMPISGVTDAEIEAGIDSPTMNLWNNAMLYTTDGQRLSAEKARPGIYIEVAPNGTTRKRIIK